MFDVLFSAHAANDIENFSSEAQQRIFAELDGVREDPSRDLRSTRDEHLLKINGYYVIVELDKEDKTIRVLAIAKEENMRKDLIPEDFPEEGGS